MGLFKLVYAVLKMVGIWKLFEKMGEENPWMGLIPILNEYRLFKKAWNTKAFWTYMICDIVSGMMLSGENVKLIPGLIGTVLEIVVIYFSFRFAKYFTESFGKQDGFKWFVFFIPGLAYMYLGFKDDTRYIGNFHEND